MSRDKQMFNDLIEIFDEEYGKRNLITPQNTAEKLTAKGYRKSTDVAEEIFAEIEKITVKYRHGYEFDSHMYELKKKYIGEGKIMRKEDESNA